MKHDVCTELYDSHIFGEFGGVNPSVTDSSTFTFMTPDKMEALFEKEVDGCYLYSRHWNPANHNLAESLAILEGAEAAQVTGSGMAAISTTLLQLCQAGDEIVAGRTIYGGTYALLKNFLPKLGITTRFVDLDDLDAVRTAINDKTRVLYCESMSNPLLEVADLPMLSELAHSQGLQVVVDNTFCPLMISPLKLGADVVVHSLTKYINGSSDCVAGAICGSREFIAKTADVNDGAVMLLGPVLDSNRSASIRKNLHTLHLRMRQHSENAMFVAGGLERLGWRVHYPGLSSHRHHERMERLMNKGFGFGGMLVLDVGGKPLANEIMTRWQEEKVGLLAVSLGYFRTLFSMPGSSTSSEIPEVEQYQMGLGEGMIRMSVGLDPDISVSLARMSRVLTELGVTGRPTPMALSGEREFSLV